MKKLLILMILLSVSAIIYAATFSKATGFITPYYEGVTLDSLVVELIDSNSTDTLYNAADVSQWDTIIDCDSLDLGMNYIVYHYLYTGVDSFITAYDEFNNYYSGHLPAIGDVKIDLNTPIICDSILHLHEYDSTYDTVAIWTDSFGYYYEKECDSLSVGVHNNIVRIKYSGVDDWMATSAIFHNTFARAYSGTANYSTITMTVVDSDGNPANNVKVSSYPIGANIVDSAGSALRGYVKNVRTDALGVATIDLIWSSYLIPYTKYMFYVHLPSGGGVWQVDSVPRQSSTTMEFTIP